MKKIKCLKNGSKLIRLHSYVTVVDMWCNDPVAHTRVGGWGGGQEALIPA